VIDESFIRSIRLEGGDSATYPFSIPAVQTIEDIDFTLSPVTFFVGENGSGKSTIVESIAVAAGFNAEGGTKNYNFSTQDTTSTLSENITLIRGPRREKDGHFLRAESFYTTANYAESGTFDKFERPIPLFFDNKRIHQQSHGEAFISIVKGFRTGLYIFDEPESALSPKRQLVLLSYIRDLVSNGSQFIIATHSPLLLAYPGATIYQLSTNGVEQVPYNAVEHVTLMKDFLEDPSEYIRTHLE
jgi:predicted ATPase